MKKGRHSRTAIMAAVVRALHTGFETPAVFEDPYAGILAGPVWRVISSSRLCYWIGTRIIYKGMDPIRRQIVARARYAEDKMETAILSGIAQYVIIGAGLDSFALRRKDLTPMLTVFELDHPASQEAKRNRLKQMGYSLPKRHEFVGINFEEKELGEALSQSSYSPQHAAFFSWLGTIYYLTPRAVINTLEAIAACAHPGSELVLDYAGVEGLAVQSDRKMVNKLKRITDRRGEPILSTFDPDQFGQIASGAGFHVLENLSPEDQASRYFRLPDGATLAMPGSYFAHLRLL